MKPSSRRADLVAILILLLVPYSIAWGATIHVPTDQPTIQAAINAASNGDTVMVAPGTYNENINFNGKAITVTSSSGPQATTIDGGQLGVVVTFNTGEVLTSVLNGFTIQNGFPTGEEGYDGGGILIQGTSPTITNNVVTENQACEGAGIAIFGGSPLVQGNTITENAQGGCSGGTDGGGILIQAGGSAQIIGNVISNNTIEFEGGGIGLFAGGTPTIMNNFISGNSAGNDGGGIGMVNGSDANIIQNIIVGNTAPTGGGVSCSVPSGNRGCFLINNTFANNTSTNAGSEISLGGFDAQVQVVNNIIADNSGETALNCDTTYSATPPVVNYNDVFNSGSGTAFGGSCTVYAGADNNISADPLFANPPKNYHLQAGSPAINAGTNSAPDLPSTDFDGNPRIQNGTVDMGAYEYFSTTMTVSPTSFTFVATPFGTTSASQPLTITNTGSLPLLESLVISGDFTENDNCNGKVAAGASCTVNVAFEPTALGIRTGSLTVTANAPPSPVTVTLTGTATGPSVQLSATTLNFGNQLQGTTSSPQVVTIGNNGTLPLLISSLTVSTGFTQTNTCSAPVAAGTGCSVSVSFAPTSTGSQTGSLTLVDNAPGTPQTVVLTGTGYIYPTPQITPPLQPASAEPGANGFTLTVNGSGFAGVSVVQWNQTELTTTFVSSTQLTAEVPASDVATAGTALVSVLNPSPGGGISNNVPFEISASTASLVFAKTDFSVGQYPQALAEGDFNHDGKTDLVVTNVSSNSVSVLLGNGDGTFQKHVDYAAGESPSAVVVADFNHDGKQDLAVVNTGCPFNGGTCSGGSVSIFLGNGDGTFQTPLTITIGVVATSAAAGDFNGDGNIDLAISEFGDSGGQVVIYLGNGDGTFQTGAQYQIGQQYSQAPSAMVAADFNRDGKLDLAVTDWSPASAVAILLGNGDGTFQNPVEYATGSSPYGLTAGDFNGDGILDLATANSGTDADSVSVLLGNGDGTFGTHVDYSTGVNPISLTASDVNGDSKLDLVTSDYNANTVSVLLGNGDGTFQENQDFATEVGPDGIVAADFNGDGHMDLAVANTLSNDVSVLLQTPPTPTPVVALSTASLTFAAQISGTNSSSQSVKLSNTGTAALTISGITSSGDFSQTNNCGASVGVGASCTISVTFKPTAGGARTGSLSIADNAANSPQSVALSGTGEDFSVTVPSGSPTSATVTPGQSATYTLSTSGEGGMSGSLTFTCTGAPSEANCTVSPSQVTLASSATTLTVTVTTTAASGGSLRLRPLLPIRPVSNGMWRLLLLTLFLAVLVRMVRRRQPNASRLIAALIPLALALLLSLGLAGCGGGGGGGSPPNSGTPAGTYNLTVTGTASSGASALSHSVTLTLTVS